MSVKGSAAEHEVARSESSEHLGDDGGTRRGCCVLKALKMHRIGGYFLLRLATCTYANKFTVLGDSC